MSHRKNRQPRPKSPIPLGGLTPGTAEHFEHFGGEMPPNLQKTPKSLPAKFFENKKNTAALGFFAGLVGVLVLTNPSHPGPRLFAEKLVPTSWYVPDCQANATSIVLDPDKFATSIRSLKVPLDAEYARLGLGRDKDGLPANIPRDNLENANYVASVWGAKIVIDLHAYDTASDVGCETPDGTFVMNEKAADFSDTLEDAGYSIDPITGNITTTK